MRAGVVALLMLVFLPAIAHAALGTCNLIPTDIQFGTFSGSEQTATGSLQITCQNGSGANQLQVGLSYGVTSPTFPNSTANRLMRSGNERLAYQIFTSSSRATIWGDGSGGTSPLSVAINYGGGQSVTKTVVPFAVLFAGALPPSGAYNDDLTVTVPGSTTAIHVRATVAATCSITANTLNFGQYSRAQLDAITTLSATCTSGTAFNIGLDQGVASGASVTTRKMTGPGSQVLSYSLHRDAARTQNWGDTVGTNTVASTGTGSAQTFTVYGRIPASQSAGAGSYQDTITVTVSF